MKTLLMIAVIAALSWLAMAACGPGTVDMSAQHCQDIIKAHSAQLAGVER